MKHSGEARVILREKYPETFKLVHLLPSAFVVGNVFLVTACIMHLILVFILKRAFSWWALLWLAPIAFYAIMVFTDSLIQNKSLKVALLSVPAAYCQLFGYGTGFIGAFFSKKQSLQREKS